MASVPDALYLDSSALVKLVVRERETAGLLRAVAGCDLVTSELALTEVPRALRRRGRGTIPPRVDAAMASLLRGLAFVPVSRGVLLRAGGFDTEMLRALDAIHLASAIDLADDVRAFVTYDRAQGGAARLAGMTVIAPA